MQKNLELYANINQVLEAVRNQRVYYFRGYRNRKELKKEAL